MKIKIKSVNGWFHIHYPNGKVYYSFSTIAGAMAFIGLIGDINE